MSNFTFNYDHNGLAHEVAKALAYTGENIDSSVAFWLIGVAGKSLEEINGHFHDLPFQKAVEKLLPRYAYRKGAMPIKLTYEPEDD
jgi:hypothetical protein